MAKNDKAVRKEKRIKEQIGLASERAEGEVKEEKGNNIRKKGQCGRNKNEVIKSLKSCHTYMERTKFRIKRQTTWALK